MKTRLLEIKPDNFPRHSWTSPLIPCSLPLAFLHLLLVLCVFCSAFYFCSTPSISARLLVRYPTALTSLSFPTCSNLQRYKGSQTTSVILDMCVPFCSVWPGLSSLLISPSLRAWVIRRLFVVDWRALTNWKQAKILNLRRANPESKRSWQTPTSFSYATLHCDFHTKKYTTRTTPSAYSFPSSPSIHPSYYT